MTTRVAVGALCLALALLAPGDSWSPRHPWAPDGPTRLLAQEVAEPAPAAEERPDEGSRWTSYGMGIAIGAAGFTAGALLGAALEGDCDGFACADEAFLVGSALGAIGAGAGVHLGNGSRGNVWLTLLTSVGIGMAGAAAAVGINDDPGSQIVAVSTIVVQMIATTEVERATGRAKARKRRAAETSGGSGGSGAQRQSAEDRGVQLSLGVSPTVRRGTAGLALAGQLRF